jgi:hypothetical protein
MSIEILDGDAIFASAIEIASPEEREAYIARACGDDVALRREVEAKVAAHFQARSAPHEPAAAREADDRVDLPRAPSAPRGEPRRSRGLAMAALLLLAVAAGSAGVAVWAWRGEEQAQAAAHQAAEEREHALQDAAEAKKQHEQAEAARQAVAQARDEAQASAQAAHRSEEDTKAVLAFFQDRLLSAGRRKDWGGGLPKDWARGLGKAVTLRQAVDAAEPEVAKVFADRPAAEASIREMLGATYQDLEEPALAVKQFERALALRKKVLGPDQPDTVSVRNKLAVAYRLAGRENDASRLYER